MEKSFTFSYPVWTIPAGEYLAAEIAFGAAALISLIYCIVIARKEQKVWPLWIFAGACLTTYWEPFTDLMLHCAYPTGAPHPLPYFFGREIPFSVFLIYIFYFALPVTWLMQRFEQGVTKRQLWKYFGVGILLVAAFEPYFVSRGWWKYYGEQPMNWTGLPVHWWFTNDLCVFGVATACHLVRKHLLTSDRQTWVLAPLCLMALWAAKAPDFPLILTMNSTADQTAITLTAFVTIAFSLIVRWIIAGVVTVTENNVAVNSQAMNYQSA